MVSPLPALDDTDWEALWAPYPDSLYQEVLSHLQPEDIVLDIGAGDMRLAVQMARLTRHVYALEVQASLIEYARAQNFHKLPHLTLLHQDARTASFPTGITTAVLLMRHCTHFHLYASKLKILGCRTLLTNARWRSGLEVIDLQTPRQSFEQISLGWYACWCGSTGFKPGPVETLTEDNFDIVYEVANCPHCSYDF